VWRDACAREPEAERHARARVSGCCESRATNEPHAAPDEHAAPDVHAAPDDGAEGAAPDEHAAPDKAWTIDSLATGNLMVNLDPMC